jgi:hypothetical protein
MSKKTKDMQDQLRKKSPRAPLIALEQAIERALNVYDQERLHAAPVDAVAQALGYKNANNGAALAAFASLRYFGLLQRPQDGFLAVSKAIETYKYAPDEQMKKQILLEFLKTPPLYHEMLEKYSVGLPSTATLKYELIQKGFLPQAVDAVLSAFLQSVAFTRYFESHNGESEQLIVPASNKELTIIEEPEKPQKPEATIKLDAIGGGDQIPIRLSGGRKAWIVIPAPFYESDKARIKAQIDVLFADRDELSGI